MKGLNDIYIIYLVCIGIFCLHGKITDTVYVSHPRYLNEILGYWFLHVSGLAHFGIKSSAHTMLTAKSNKTFSERQRPRQAEIRKCEHQLSVVITYSDPLNGILHPATKFQAVLWFPQFHLPGPSLLCNLRFIADRITKFHYLKK